MPTSGLQTDRAGRKMEGSNEPVSHAEHVIDALLVRLTHLCVDERRSKDLRQLGDGLNTIMQARTYPALAGALKVCLPDEAYPVSALLYKPQSADWHLRLQEKIIRQKRFSANNLGIGHNSRLSSSSNSVSSAASAVSNGHGGSSNSALGGLEAFNEISFRLRGQQFSSNTASTALTLDLVGSSSGLMYSVIFNDMGIAHRTAALEDISRIVGHDGLFKRSLLLAKTWCLYELPRYAHIGSTVLRRFINPETILIMVIAIFATQPVKTPLEALCAFLREFANFDWNHQALTVFGPLQKDRILAADFTLDRLVPENLTNSGFAQSFFDSFAKHKPTLQIPTADTFDSFVDVSSANVGPFGYNQQQSSTSVSLTGGGQDAEAIAEIRMACSSDYSMVVIDPLQPALNLGCGFDSDIKSISEKIGSISEGFRRGSDALLLEISALKGEVHSEDQMFEKNNCHLLGLTGTQSMLSSWTTTDSNSYSESISARSFKLLERSRRIITDLITDSALVVCGKVTGDAVAHVIVHLLEREGKSQTIGEIGKMLQEVVGNPNLARIIKNSFRGLKRLISLYPTLFRLGDEHSFNPHIYLMAGAYTTGTSIGCFEAPRPSSLVSSVASAGSARSETSSVASAASDRDFDDLEGFLDYSGDEHLSSSNGHNSLESSAVSVRQPNSANLTGCNPSPTDSTEDPSLALDPSATEFSFSNSGAFAGGGQSISPREPGPRTGKLSVQTAFHDYESLETDLEDSSSSVIGDMTGRTQSPNIDSDSYFAGAGVSPRARPFVPMQHQQGSPRGLGNVGIGVHPNNAVVTKQGRPSRKDAKQVPLPLSTIAATTAAGTIVIPSPSAVTNITPPPYITAASGATIVDPSTGSKVYNPVKPQVWVPGKFAGALGPPSLASPPHNVSQQKPFSKPHMNVGPGGDMMMYGGYAHQPPPMPMPMPMPGPFPGPGGPRMMPYLGPGQGPAGPGPEYHGGHGMMLGNMESYEGPGMAMNGSVGMLHSDPHTLFTPHALDVPFDGPVQNDAFHIHQSQTQSAQEMQSAVVPGGHEEFSGGRTRLKSEDGLWLPNFLREL